MKKIFILFFLLYGVVYGQTSTHEKPVSLLRSIPPLTLNEQTQKIMPNLDMNIQNVFHPQEQTLLHKTMNKMKSLLFKQANLNQCNTNFLMNYIYTLTPTSALSK